VGYVSSLALREHYVQRPELCCDYDERDKCCYRPVLAPDVGHGTPYVQPGAFPTFLRYLDRTGSGSSSSSTSKGRTSYEQLYDDWLAKGLHCMPLSSASDVRGQARTSSGSSSGSPNHSCHSAGSGSRSLTKGSSAVCAGLLMVRADSGFALSVTPDKEVQAQLDAVLCGSDNGAGSAVAIAEVLIREHFFHLNAALLEPFRLLANSMQPATADKEAEDMARLHSFYGSGPEIGNEGKDDGAEGKRGEGHTGGLHAEAEVEAAEEELVLLKGAIAVFQRQSIPSTRRHSDPADTLYVPPGMRKVFFDNASSASGTGSACSP
jgi:hypothetical protein